MSVFFSLDSFKMCFHFQNVLSFSKCWDGDNFCNAFEGARITKPLLYSMNMLPNWSAFISLDLINGGCQSMHGVK